MTIKHNKYQILIQNGLELSKIDKRLCRDRGQLFEDPDFTPTNQSIYRNKKPSLHPIVWLRPRVSSLKDIHK